MLQSFLEKFDAIFRLAFSKQKLLALSQRFLRIRRGRLVRRDEITLIDGSLSDEGLKERGAG